MSIHLLVMVQDQSLVYRALVLTLPTDLSQPHQLSMNAELKINLVVSKFTRKYMSQPSENAGYNLELENTLVCLY